MILSVGPVYGLSFFSGLIYSCPFQVFSGSERSDMKMKIGVLSDTPLCRVTRDLKDIYDRHLSDVDIILHAGDFTSPEIIGFLSRKNFHGVSGNMDPVEVKRVLPGKKEIDLGSHRVGLIHGWGSSDGLEDRIWQEFQNVDVIVYGHSHRAANHMKNDVLFFNPGSAIGYTSSRVHTLGFLEIDDNTIHGEIITV